MKRKIQRIAALLVTAAALAGFASCKSDIKPDDGTKDVPVGSDYPEYLPERPTAAILSVF